MSEKERIKALEERLQSLEKTAMRLGALFLGLTFGGYLTVDHIIDDRVDARLATELTQIRRLEDRAFETAAEFAVTSAKKLDEVTIHTDRVLAETEARSARAQQLDKDLQAIAYDVEGIKRAIHRLGGISDVDLQHKVDAVLAVSETREAKDLLRLVTDVTEIQHSLGKMAVGIDLAASGDYDSGRYYSEMPEYATLPDRIRVDLPGTLDDVVFVLATTRQMDWNTDENVGTTFVYKSKKHEIHGQYSSGSHDGWSLNVDDETFENRNHKNGEFFGYFASDNDRSIRVAAAK